MAVSTCMLGVTQCHTHLIFANQLFYGLLVTNIFTVRQENNRVAQKQMWTKLSLLSRKQRLRYRIVDLAID